MLSEKELFEIIHENGVSYWCGVPDSVLYELISYAENRCECVIAANEGNAVALAAGYYLATNNVACVFMQNSGLGNAINPIISLCHETVYNIPILMIIGWRGEPGCIDEPQHLMEGKTLTSLLTVLGIGYTIIENDTVENTIRQVVHDVKSKKQIHAFLVHNKAFVNKSRHESSIQGEMTRYEALESIHHFIGQDDIVVTSTGMISREWYDIRNRYNEGHDRDFLNVGAMGHELQIALALAMCIKDKIIICIEGDGACMMHMGGMSSIGGKNIDNLIHIVICNGIHDSIGGIATAAPLIDFAEVAKGCGYDNVFSAFQKNELTESLNKSLGSGGTTFIQLYVNSKIETSVERPENLKKLGHDFINKNLKS